MNTIGNETDIEWVSYQIPRARITTVWSQIVLRNRTWYHPHNVNRASEARSTEAYIRHFQMRYYLNLANIITRYEIVIAWYEII